MRVFDTHAHYDSGAFNADRLELLAGMPQQDVALIVNPGCDLETSRTVVELADRFPFVYAAVGVHPSDCGPWQDSWVDELKALAAHPKVKAIGEIGLDYYWKENPPKEFQQMVFHRQMELAQELRLPVIIHDREAHHDCLEVVRSHPQVTGVYHCYSGSLEDAKVLVKLEWMLSFTGTITYKNARKALEVIDWLPMDRIMIETDSPYLTPEPFRGKRNDSGKVHLVAEKIAEVKGMDAEGGGPHHSGKRQTVFPYRGGIRDMTITYEYEGALYVNLTNKCNCNCEFCLRHGEKEGSIYTEDSLWLEREPTRQEALDSFLSRDIPSYREIVFCGYGEPTYRLDDILCLVDELKAHYGDQLPPVRINTNGHANLINGRDVCPELKGRIDTLSISLNANNAADYVALCHPIQGEEAYQAMLDFAKESKTYVPHVVFTVVDKGTDPAEIEESRSIAQSLGVQLRVRAYIDS